MWQALVARWRHPGPVPGAAQRWVVLDVEASGLDPRRDRLIAVAALAVQAHGATARIVPGDSFEVVLRQPPEADPDRENILLHGIGVAAQQRGVEPAEGLAALADYLGDAPVIGFHVAFDRMLIERACRAHRRPRPGNAWMDLAHLAEVVAPEVKARSLDEWMAHFGIECARRHEAAADALATAELLLVLYPRAVAQAGPGFAALQRLAGQRRWLTGG